MRRLSRTLWLALFASLPASAAEEAWFGFSQRVGISMFMNVESAVVNQVAEGGPAALAGIKSGDEIVAIDGCAIPGCGAFQAKKLMQKPVGEKAVFKLRRADGQLYQAELTAVPPPQKDKK